MVALRGNMQVLQYVHALLFIVAGLACGVLGVQGGMGVLTYLATHVLLVLVLLALTGGKTMNYFAQSPHILLLSGLYGQITAFLLFWALGFSVVHVF